MNHIPVISFSLTILLAMPLLSMQSMETNDTESHGTKRKHDELYTIHEPLSLTKQAARSFVQGYTISFKSSKPANRKGRCLQFWQDCGMAPTDVQELLFYTLNQEWEPVSTNNPSEAKKFKVFTLLFNLAPTEDLKDKLAYFFTSEKAKRAFSSAITLSPYEIISYKAFDNASRKNIICKLNNDQSFALGMLLFYKKTHEMKRFLKLGLNVQSYSENPPDTLLSYAIKLFDLKKIRLLLQYNTAIPMFSLTDNAISQLCKYKKRNVSNPKKGNNDIYNIIEKIVVAMNKKIIKQRWTYAFNNNRHSFIYFIIANSDETDVPLVDCQQLTYSFNGTNAKTPFYLSPGAARDLLGKAIIPQSQEPVANT